MKSLHKVNLSDKRVLLRSALDVPVKDGKVTDPFRILKTMPTIEYLIEQGAKTIILSKRGHDKDLTLKPVAEYLGEKLEQRIKFVADCIGKHAKKAVSAMRSGDVIVLENVRFYEEEKNNDEDFARELAALGEIYVNDAFADSHREHASIATLPKLLPAYPGMLMEKEHQVLSRVVTSPWRPLTAIIGGMKFESKAGTIDNFLRLADEVLIGGGIANQILQSKGIMINKPAIGDNEIAAGLELTDSKLHLPLDVIVSPDKEGEVYVRESAPAAVRKEELILDIGTETINMFKEIIARSKMIVWSGPLGYYENERFAKGTTEIADAVARNHKAFRVAGGGDTVAALTAMHAREQFDFISTGGGAMLDFLAGDVLPGVRALEQADNAG